MDCTTALRTLEVCRPSGDDWTDPELALAIAHVDQCPSCVDQVRFRQSFDSRVTAAMQQVPIPHDLRDRIQARLEACPTRRSYLKRATGIAWLVAAAAVAIVSASAYFWPRPSQSPIEIDWKGLGELAILEPNDIDELHEVPDGLTDPRLVHDWCSRQVKRFRLSASLPAGWPQRELTAVGRATVRDQRVALFRFEDDRGESDILALPNDRFRVAGLGSGIRLVMRTRNLVVVAWSSQETTYLAVLKDWSPDDWKQLVQASNELT